MDPGSRRRLAAGCGVGAPLLALSAILASTVLADWFLWSEHALSDLGRASATTFALFNGGLVAAGLLGIPFVGLLWADHETPIERAGVACYGLAIVGMALVGVFFLGHTDWYLDRSLHEPVALAFFVGAPVSNLLLGWGAIRAGERRWGAATLGIGLAHLLFWGGWLLAMGLGIVPPGAWFGLVEFAAALSFGAWTVAAALRRF